MDNPLRQYRINPAPEVYALFHDAMPWREAIEERNRLRQAAFDRFQAARLRQAVVGAVLFVVSVAALCVVLVAP